MSEVVTLPDYIAIFLLVIGFASVLNRFILVFFRLKINTKAFNDQVIKLMKAGNVDRAIKLCNAAPNALYSKGLKGALEAVRSGQKDPQTLQTRFNEALGDPASIAKRLGPIKLEYDQQFPALDEAASRFRYRAYLGVALAAAAVITHFLAGAPASQASKSIFGSAGATLFLTVVSEIDTVKMVKSIKSEFARFVEEAQYYTGD